MTPRKGAGRGPLRLGGPAWHDPDPRRDGRALHCQQMYLRRISWWYPHVLEALEATVLPPLAAEETYLNHPDLEQRLGFMLPEFWPLAARERFGEYLHEYHLRDPWATEVAAMTVCRWISKKPQKRLRWRLDWLRMKELQATGGRKNPFTFNAILISINPLEAGFPQLDAYGPWNMCRPWEEYESRLPQVLVHQARRYFKACLREAEFLGLAPAPTLKARHGRPADQPFRWLLEWQYTDLTLAEIGRGEVSAQAVGAAIRNLASLMHLTDTPKSKPRS
jgi:hypothetical protein